MQLVPVYPGDLLKNVLPVTVSLFKPSLSKTKKKKKRAEQATTSSFPTQLR